MKCLSLWQPWASLIVNGSKSVETRGWFLHHRGPLLIHAAKTWNSNLAMHAVGDPFRRHLEAAGVEFTATEAAARKGWNLPFGAIVGVVDVLGCYPVDHITVARESRDADRPIVGAGGKLFISKTELRFGDFSDGRFGFLLGNPVRFDTPIPFRGAQGLFDVPDATVAGEVPVARSV